MERTPRFQKDDLVTVKIGDIGASGEGIGRADGFALFIKDALPGDTVLAKIMKVKKGYGYARLMAVTEPSPFRVPPKCGIARPCGGCQIQELEYPQQLAFKYRKVRNDLLRIGGFSEELVNRVLAPVLGMEIPYRFRNKAQFPVGRRGTEPIAGFYAGRTHAIVSVEDCMIGPAENRKIVRAVLDYMKDCGVPAYEEKTGEGLVRHILIRSGFSSGEVMVCLVINGTGLPEEERLVKALRDCLPDEGSDAGSIRETLPEISHSASYGADGTASGAELPESAAPGSEGACPAAVPHIVSICINVNREKTNVIMGRKSRTLWGKETMEDSLEVMDVLVEPEERIDGLSDRGSGKEESAQTEDRPASGIPASAGKAAISFRGTGRHIMYRISPVSFYQVNPGQTQRLYGLVRHFAGLTGKEVVWDLYCGVGTISCYLAGDAKAVYGVEVIPEAVRDARENARRNGLHNCTFEVGKAEEVLPAYVKKGEGGSCRVDVIVVDPPRKGCDSACLQTILEIRPEKLIYVSCDPATLARDLKILTDGGYELRAAQPVDMFPHSVHVETVVLLSQP